MVICKTYKGDEKPHDTEGWSKYVVRVKGRYQRGINVLVRDNGTVYFLGYVKEYEEGKTEIIELTNAIIRRENIDVDVLKQVAKSREVVSA